MMSNSRDTLVGRSREMAELMLALEGAMSGQGRTVMLAGEPGIGKTRIARELAAMADERGARVLWGGCYEDGDLSLPYRPFVEALRSYLLDRADEDLSQEKRSSLAELARIVPDIARQANVELIPPGDPAEDRYRLLSAVSDFLSDAASLQPLVLVIEDLHHADSGTLDMLTHVARNLAGSRLLLIGTYRDTELEWADTLSKTIGGLLRVPMFSRIMVGGLAVDEIRKMAQSMTETEIPLTLANAVERETDGNALFVQELLRYLINQGLLNSGGDDWRGSEDGRLFNRTPEGLRGIIGMRLSRLDGPCAQILAVASVIGREFPLHLLRQVADVPEDEVDSALEKAQGAGVIEEHSSVGATVTYRFVHELFRQTLYEETPAPRRIRLHQKIAAVLEQNYPTRLDENAAELARHFSYSPDAGDLAKTVEYSERAANRAMSGYAYTQAARLLERALEVHEEIAPDDLARKCDLVLALGEALLPAGEPLKVVTEIAVQASELAELLRDDTRAVRACNLGLWEPGAELAVAAFPRRTVAVRPSSPIRAEFVDALDREAWSGLGVEIDGDPMGAPAYHPRALLSVWLYGFMTKVRSCRKLEAACRDQIPFLWLTGWQHPDHNTLWRFYQRHRQNMRELFKSTVRTAVSLELVDLAVQAVDGTKVAGNASAKQTYTGEQLSQLLHRVEKVIEELEAQNEGGEDGDPVHLPEKLSDRKTLRQRVRQAMEELPEPGRYSQYKHPRRINLTDRDARSMKTAQGFVPSYNAQAMVSPLSTDGEGPAC